jgi:hypothetical protein
MSATFERRPRSRARRCIDWPLFTSKIPMRSLNRLFVWLSVLTRQHRLQGIRAAAACAVKARPHRLSSGDESALSTQAMRALFGRDESAPILAPLGAS